MSISVNDKLIWIAIIKSEKPYEYFSVSITIIPNLLKIPVNEIIVHSSLRYLIKWTLHYPSLAERVKNSSYSTNWTYRKLFYFIHT
jgi:hypothetical protein